MIRTLSGRGIFRPPKTQAQCGTLVGWAVACSPLARANPLVVILPKKMLYVHRNKTGLACTIFSFMYPGQFFSVPFQSGPSEAEAPIHEAQSTRLSLSG